MKVAKNLDELKKLIKSDIDSSLVDGVFPAVQRRMIKHIALDVYQEYEPNAYVRRYDKSGAITNYLDFKFDKSRNKGLLSDENIKYYFTRNKSNETGIYVFNDTLGAYYYFVWKQETKRVQRKNGGYRVKTYIRRRRYRSKNAGRPIAGVIESGVGYDIHGWKFDGVPRPFIANTAKDLQESGDHIKAFIKSMRAKGYDIK